MAKQKERLDKLMVARDLVVTRSKAQGLIMAGEVLVDGQPVVKAGTAVSLNAVIELKTPLPYVGRGGFKLAGALQTFGLDVAGRICADVGACTGGFTDVLLQNAAAKVYALDVGYGQLDWKLDQQLKTWPVCFMYLILGSWIDVGNLSRKSIFHCKLFHYFLFIPNKSSPLFTVPYEQYY